MNSSSPLAPRHFPVFDALRGYAILGVLVVHSALPYGPLLNEKHAELAKCLSYGRFGVQLFYMVSACTLFWSMASRTSVDARPLGAFFLRRFFRIAPLFWIGACAYLWESGLSPRFNAPDGLGFLQIAGTFIFAHGVHPASINALVPGGWSIAVEMPFYLLVPLAFAYVKNLRGALRFFVFTFVLSQIANAVCEHFAGPHFTGNRQYLLTQFVELWLPNQLPIFGLGFVLYFLVRDHLRNPVLNKPQLSTGSKPDYVLLWTVLIYGGWSFFHYWTVLLPTIEAAGFLFLLFAWMLVWWPIKLLVNPVIEHIGKISYSIYIWHFFVLHLMIKYLVPVNTFRSSPVRYLVLLGAMVVAMTLVGTVSYFLIEKPMITVGKMVINRLRWGPVRTPRTVGAALVTTGT